eukprot:m.43851 g.43851  ORF g.43851 m.43851 type:complete len:65 (+) comp10800_c0_seq1:5624-5818(+)
MGCAHPLSPAFFVALDGSKHTSVSHLSFVSVVDKGLLAMPKKHLRAETLLSCLCSFFLFYGQSF